MRGNFEGRNIPNLIGRWDTSPPERLDEARAALYEARSQRVWPGLDDKRLASWNALMISALADAGAVLGRDDYLDAARAAAEFVLDEMRDADGRLLRSWKDGEAKLNAYLEDHAYLLEALLTLYEATFEVRWFDAARETADAMIARFADPERGGFFTTSEDHEQLIARRKDVDDHPIPSGNSSARLRPPAAGGADRRGLVRGAGRVGVQALRPGRGRAPPGRPAHAARDRLPPLAGARGCAGRPRGDRGARRAGRGGALAAPPAPGAGGRAGGQRAPRAAARAARRRRPGGRLRLRELRLPGAGDRARGARSVAGRIDCADGRENRVEAKDSRASSPRPTSARSPTATSTSRSRCGSRARRDLIHGIADLKAPNDIKAFFNGLFAAFPDYEFEILELAASGKNAACRWHSTGTFLGPGRFQGLAPTGARIELEGCDMLRVEDGLIVENNAYVNGALIAQQLGLLPQQGSTADRVVTGAFNAKTAALGHLRRLRD